MVANMRRPGDKLPAVHKKKTCCRTMTMRPPTRRDCHRCHAHRGAQPGSAFETTGTALFTPEYWRARGALTSVARGRGSAWFVATGQRNGYCGITGAAAGSPAPVRPIATCGAAKRRCARSPNGDCSQLRERGLPVPEPIGACYHRGPSPSGAIRSRGVSPAPSPLRPARREATGAGLWRSLGATIARFHAAGVDHADLTAHNILATPEGYLQHRRFRPRPAACTGPLDGRQPGRLQTLAAQGVRHAPTGTVTSQRTGTSFWRLSGGCRTRVTALMRRLYTLLVLFLPRRSLFAVLCCAVCATAATGRACASASDTAKRCGGDAPCIWVHAVSLGEVTAAAPLMRELKRRHPDAPPRRPPRPPCRPAAPVPRAPRPHTRSAASRPGRWPARS